MLRKVRKFQKEKKIKTKLKKLQKFSFKKGNITSFFFHLDTP